MLICMTRRFCPLWRPCSSSCGGLVAFGHLKGTFLPSNFDNTFEIVTMVESMVVFPGTWWGILGWVHFYHYSVSLDVIFTSVSIFSSLSRVELYQIYPVLKVIHGGCWWFLAGYIENGVLFTFDNHFLL